jgi:DNA polymerase I
MRADRATSGPRVNLAQVIAIPGGESAAVRLPDATRPGLGRPSGRRTARYPVAVAGPILVLDAFSLLFRAFHALPPLTTKAGVPTSALYGMSALLIKLLRERRPRGAVVARDLPGPTFRHEQYARYKETRVAPPSALTQQIARLGELTGAFGFPTYGAPGFEADDVLATLARELLAAGETPMVVSGDRDTLQLARGPVTVLHVGRSAKDTLYDEAAVGRRFGVSPEKLPDFMALVGDTSDDIPGVPGIGAKTAADLIRRFGTVAAVLDSLDQIGPPRLRQALARHAAELRLWRSMTELRDDVPLPAGPRYSPTLGIDRVRLGRLFEELEFTSLTARLDEALTACARVS